MRQLTTRGVLCVTFIAAAGLSAMPALPYGRRAATKRRGLLCQTRQHSGDKTRKPGRKPMPARHDNRDLLTELKTLRHALADPHTTVANLIHSLGETSDKIEGSGYQVLPRQAWFSGIFVGISTDAAAMEKPSDVDLTLRPNVTLRLAELDAAFGRHTAGHPNRVFPFTYQYHAPEPGDRIVVLAYMRRDPSDPQSRVEEIKIMRDE